MLAFATKINVCLDPQKFPLCSVETHLGVGVVVGDILDVPPEARDTDSHRGHQDRSAAPSIPGIQS